MGKLRTLLLKLFIGSLVFSALLAIFSVLLGDFGALVTKVLVTTFTFSAASICLMACAAFAEKRNAKLGFVGIALAVFSETLILLLVWAKIGSTEYWKFTISTIVIAVGFAHALLLHLPNLNRRYSWAQKLSGFLIGLLAFQIIVAVWGEVKDDLYYKLMTVSSILVTFITLLVPILSVIARGLPESMDSLKLTKTPDGTYRDKDGKLYIVKEIKTEHVE